MAIKPLDFCDVPLCKKLRAQDIDALQDLFEIEEVGEGVDLIRDECRNRTVFIICSGSVMIVHRPDTDETRILNILGHGEILGEMSVIDGVAASATVTTLEPCHLLRIEGDKFCQLLLQFPRLSLNLLTAQSQRIRTLSQRVQTIAHSSVRCRIAHQLLLFAESYGIPLETDAEDGLENIFLPLRLKQRDLANLVGTTREQVNRTLSALQTDGSLSIGKDGRLTLHDTQLLLRHCS